MTPIAQAIAVAAVAIGTGTATLTVLKEDVDGFVVPEAPWAPSAALDGRTFQIAGQIIENGEALSDTLLFKDGQFQSVNCQEYCDFGWSTYETWTEGEVIHFTATTICPTAPHSVVWHGQIVGDKMELAGQWTTDRWYWTRQISFEGTGTLQASDTGAETG